MSGGVELQDQKYGAKLLQNSDPDVAAVLTQVNLGLGLVLWSELG